MYLKCKNCGHKEKINTKLIGTILGTATSGFGMFAWTSFLFAGTGMAAALCTAIVAGGPAIYAYKNKLIKWIVDKGYKCEQCGDINWEVVPEKDTEVINDINSKFKYIEQCFKKHEKYTQNFIDKTPIVERIKDDPNNVGTILRKIAEYGTKLILNEYYGEKYDSSNYTFENMIQQLKKRNIDKTYIDILYEIKKIGNKSSHPQDTTKLDFTDILPVAKNLCIFLDFLDKTLSKSKLN